MKQKLFTPRNIILFSIILIAALSRILPHPANVAPITAIALFGGAYFLNRQLAFTLPLLVMLLSDVALELLFGYGFHNTMFFVYGSFVAIAGIGLLLKGRIKILPVIGASLAGSVLFFIITNFGVWATSPYYAKTIDGLFTCYIAAIPFFRNAVLGDLFYVAIMFGGFELAKYKLPKLAKVRK